MAVSRRVALAGFLAVALAAPAVAKEPYVTAGMVDLAGLLPPPPAAGSAAGAADLQAVLDAQARASAARKAQAVADAGESVFVMFTPVLGETFAAEELPKVSHLFARIGDSESATVDAAKQAFGKPRPWQASSLVVPIPKPSKSFSYPSGHTTRVTLCAIVLAAMLPERAGAIWARADDYAQSRVIAGEHYPSDLVGGGRAGTAVAAVMLRQADFQADFDAAKAELRAAMGL